MQETAILYGPTKGSVAKVARMIADQLPNAGLVEVKHIDAGTFKKYNHLILGLSTIGRANWDSPHTDVDWDVFMAHIDQIDWTGKTVAIFGLGDQTMYPDNFVDAIAWLYDRLARKNIKIVGHTSPEGYKFNDSEAFREGVFLGLPVDEDNEPDLTPGRVKNWLEQLKKEGF
ncbi:MAG: flavodoxin [Breznakibacter sp.]